MSVLGELLFHRQDQVDLDDVLRHQGQEVVRQIVDGLPDSKFANHSDDELTAQVVTQVRVTPLSSSLRPSSVPMQSRV